MATITPRASCLRVMGLVVALVLCSAALGQEAANETPPAERFAAQISTARTMAKSLNDEYAQIADASQMYLTFAADDLAKAKGAYDSLASDFEKAAGTWEHGDDVAAMQLYKKAEQGLATKEPWRVRLTELRRNQADIAPTEEWCRENEAVASPGALPAFRRFVAAKKAAADAFGTAAEATVPGADVRTVKELKDKAYALRAEVEIASWEYHWAHRLDGMWFDKSVTKEEIEKPLAALLLRQEELVKLERERIAHQRSVQEAQAGLSQAEQQFGEAMWAVHRAHADAAAKK